MRLEADLLFRHCRNLVNGAIKFPLPEGNTRVTTGTVVHEGFQYVRRRVAQEVGVSLLESCAKPSSHLKSQLPVNLTTCPLTVARDSAPTRSASGHTVAEREVCPLILGEHAATNIADVATLSQHALTTETSFAVTVRVIVYPVN